MMMIMINVLSSEKKYKPRNFSIVSRVTLHAAFNNDRAVFRSAVLSRLIHPVGAKKLRVSIDYREQVAIQTRA